jgi:GNAT superfamily N-acetyltransferase
MGPDGRGRPGEYPVIEIRRMAWADVDFGMQLCRLANWNQLEADWRRLFAISPEGLFVAECDGQRCGTASAVNYGRALGWIGMMLVHPDYRRRGVASVLLDRCIRHLRALEVESIKLDATEQGRPVYLKSGFRDEQPIHRMIQTHRGIQKQPSPEVRAPFHDWARVASMDDEAFGADRVALLRLLGNDGESAATGDGRRISGYGLARRGFHAAMVGPVIAVDGATAGVVLESLLSRLPVGSVYADVLPRNGEAEKLFRSMGFAVERRLTRMWLGAPGRVGRTEMIFSAAGFELG